jgi:hypothetical protein
MNSHIRLEAHWNKFSASQLEKILDNCFVHEEERIICYDIYLAEVAYVGEWIFLDPPNRLHIGQCWMFISYG